MSVSPPCHLDKTVEGAAEYEVKCGIFKYVEWGLFFVGRSLCVFHIITSFMVSKKMR